MIHPGARQGLQPLDGAVATLELRGLGSSKPRGGTCIALGKYLDDVKSEAVPPQNYRVINHSGEKRGRGRGDFGREFTISPEASDGITAS